MAELTPEAQLINTFRKICHRTGRCNKCDGSDCCNKISQTKPPEMWTEEDITNFLNRDKKTVSQIVPAGGLVEDDEEV